MSKEDLCRQAAAAGKAWAELGPRDLGQFSIDTEKLKAHKEEPPRPKPAPIPFASPEEASAAAKTLAEAVRGWKPHELSSMRDDAWSDWGGDVLAFLDRVAAMKKDLPT
jgi:hypothetical protein